MVIPPVCLVLENSYQPAKYGGRYSDNELHCPLFHRLTSEWKIVVIALFSFSFLEASAVRLDEFETVGDQLE